MPHKLSRIPCNDNIKYERSLVIFFIESIYVMKSHFLEWIQFSIVIVKLITQ